MSSISYPKSCVWYVEARPSKEPGAVRSAGSAVCIRLKHSDDEQPRKYLLTCSHVVRAQSADGRLAAGPLLPLVLCWAPGRGFVPIKEPSDWPSPADSGVWTARVVDVYNRPPERLQPHDLEKSRDWLLLDVEQPDFQDYPSVTRWESTSASGNSIVGFPAGAGTWTPGTIVQSLMAENFRVEVTSSTPALTVLTGPEETAPGMSGGGIFNPALGFGGLHRAQSVAARQIVGIKAKHIEDELSARGYSTIASEPDAVQKESVAIGTRAKNEYFRFPNDAGSIYSKAACVVVIAFLIAAFTGYASPYPNEMFMTILAPLAAFVALTLAFRYCLKSETTKQRRQQLPWWFGSGAAFFFIAYFGLFSAFVVIDEAQGSKEVVGFILQPDVDILRQSQSPPLTDRQLLENLGGEPERVWTKISILIVGMSLLVVWILMWFLMALTVGVVLCDSWLRKQTA